MYLMFYFFFFFQAEDGIRDVAVTGVQTCALPILMCRAYLTRKSTVNSWPLRIVLRSPPTILVNGRHGTWTSKTCSARPALLSAGRQRFESWKKALCACLWKSHATRTTLAFRKLRAVLPATHAIVLNSVTSSTGKRVRPISKPRLT